MKKKKPIVLTIPSPCSQKWEEMTKTSQGRFCDHCKKDVIDFSGLSDAALHQKMLSAPGSCGRFTNTQLNRLIFPLQQKKNPLRPLAGIAASLALLSACNEHTGDSKIQQPTSQHPTGKKEDKYTEVKNFCISGKVYDPNDMPIEMAEVRFNGEMVALTDKNGLFSFSPANPDTVRLNLLEFSYPGLETKSTNYHISHGNEGYTIRMQPKGVFTDHTIGFVDFRTKTEEFPFDEFVTIIHGELAPGYEKVISSLSALARSKPDKNKIEIFSCAKSKVETENITRLINSVEEYLVQKEGISRELITLKVLPYKKSLHNKIKITTTLIWEPNPSYYSSANTSPSQNKLL